MYFKSEIARKHGSKARHILNSASEGLSAFSDAQKVKIIFVAIMLGGSTLELFKNSL